MEMDGTMLRNPFVVGRYVSDEYFCDREKETEFLLKQVDNGRNVAIISPRRMGKTGLIQHLFHREELNERFFLFFVDIYATSSLAEFVYLLSKAIYDELRPRKRAWVERFFSIVTSMRVGFKLDALTGEPGLDISLGEIRTPMRTLEEIFQYLESVDRPCLVAIDEFQQIGTYGESGVEALLRTRIQQCRQTQFIFSGSKRHMMAAMFNSPAKPFYQSAVSMGLEAIPGNVYLSFVTGMFKKYGKCIEPAAVKTVYQKYEGCTWFVQMMMNELFALTAQGECCNVDKVMVAKENVIHSQEGAYKELLAQLAPRQKAVLQAIAKDGRVSGITSASFISRYGLSSASSVQSAVKSLLKNDIITQENGEYRVYDYFFGEWLREY